MGDLYRVTAEFRECAYDSHMVAHGLSGERSNLLRRSLEVALFVVLPVVVLLPFLMQAYRQGILGIDLEQTLLPAARAIARGDSPYPAYGYPPLVAFGLMPLVVLPGPNIVFAALLIACVPASLWFLGVRDWRCFGICFLWASVLSAVQTGNVTILLLLATAICWYGRDRWKMASVGGGLAVAAKIICWPLVVWLGATRRWTAAIGVVAVSAGVTIILWALLGFSGLLDYPSSLGTLDRAVSAESYTVKALFLDLSTGVGLARLAGILVALGVLAGSIVLGRRGDDRRSFALAVTAMIVASPIVWLHSFALLLAPVAVLRPRLSAAWLLPVLMVIGTGTGNGTAWQTAGVLGIAALTLVIALLPPGGSGPVAPVAVPGQLLPPLPPAP